MSALIDAYPEISATEAGSRFGSLLSTAQRGPVKIVRHGEKFVLMRAEDFEQRVALGGNPYPRLTLGELVAGYDREQHRSNWPDDAPVGKEQI